MQELQASEHVLLVDGTGRKPACKGHSDNRCPAPDDVRNNDQRRKNEEGIAKLQIDGPTGTSTHWVGSARRCTKARQSHCTMPNNAA